MVMRLLISLALAIAFVCGGETPARAVDVFDIVRVTHPSANVEIVSIGQPNVKQAVTEYTSITFAPGDAVMVTADGCVQTGGSGETWKRSATSTTTTATTVTTVTTTAPKISAPAVTEVRRR